MLNKKIASALQNEVAKTAKETMREVIEKEVYDKYTPKDYKRKKDRGGLTDYDNMQITVIDDNTIKLRNVRNDWEGTGLIYDYFSDSYLPSGVPRPDRDVSAVVESGEGYEWEGVDLPPRPFHKPTKEKLEDTGRAAHALYKGLKRQGLKVKVK